MLFLKEFAHLFLLDCVHDAKWSGCVRDVVSCQRKVSLAL